MAAQSIQCVMVGDGAVGKTSLVVNALGGTAHSGLRQYKTRLCGGSSDYALLVQDTDGQDDYGVQPLLHADVDLFLVCYSVISPSSYENVRAKWIPAIRHYSAAPIVLIACKADLRGDPEVLRRLAAKHLTPVTTKQGKDLAVSCGVLCFLEASCDAQKARASFHAALQKYFKKHEYTKPNKKCTKLTTHPDKQPTPSRRASTCSIV